MTRNWTPVLALLALSSASACASDPPPEPDDEQSVCKADQAAADCPGGEPDPEPAAPGAHVWSRSYGDPGQQFAHAAALDACGNAYLTGHFFGTVDFGTGSIPGNGPSSSAPFVAKLSASGQGLWGKRLTRGDAVAYRIAADPCGNTVVTGTFSGTADFGGGALEALYSDLFVVKLDPAGEHLWSLQGGGEVAAFGPSVAIGPGGEVVVAGSYLAPVDLGGGALEDAGGADVFVAKLDAGGEHLWSVRAGDAESQFAAEVAVDGSGNVIVVGRFRGAIDFGGDVLTSQSQDAQDIFVVKLDPDGKPLWSRRIGGATVNGLGSGLAVDSAGAIYLTGNFKGTLDLGGATITASQNQTFVAKLTAAGQHAWSKVLGASTLPPTLSIAAGADGDVRLGGVFSGTVDFGGGPRAATGATGTDPFVVRLDASGGWVWDRVWSGDSFSANPVGLAVGAGGDLFLTGDYYGTVDFGGGPMTAQPDPLIPNLNGPDIFAVRLAP